jgi:caffeoyl-CoA O-methyltransferase
MSTVTSPRPVTPAGILAQKLEALVRLAEDRPELTEAFRASLREVSELASWLDPYVTRWSTPASAALDALEERTRTHDWGSSGPLEQEMLSGQVEGQVLKMLVHATRARRVLEIGMFTGYSALAMAEALPADGKVVALELDGSVAAFARAGFDAGACGDRIDVRVGPAQESLVALAGCEPFDLVFVDADKAGYRGYLSTLLGSGLLAPHALICVDNTLMQGEPWTSAESSANGAAIHEFNQFVAGDPRVEQVIVPLRDGLTLIRRTAV